MSQQKIHVFKRNGERAPFEFEKWSAQIAKVCEGIDGVSPSMIEIAAQAHFYDGMQTRELDQMALRAMIDLIDEEEHPDTGNVNYQYAAGKQRISMLRKDVYGDYTPPRLYDVVKKNVADGFYTPELLEWYTEAEWDQIEKFVDHDKDELLPYAAVDQLIEKYLVQDRTRSGSVVETPQVRYAVAAATAFHAEKKDRMRWVRDFYGFASDGLFTLATPVLAGLGTKTKQFSSCVLIKANDTLKSIFATGQVMADYAAKRAGIGLEIGRLRPLGAPIRGGEVKHTGMVPFLKKWFADLRSCSQGGIRNASATTNFPFWHYQVEDLMVLKNNQGTDETRVRHLDYCVVVSAKMWERFYRKGVISMFDPNEVPDMYEAYYRDHDEFCRLYDEYEKRTDVKVKKLNAESFVKDLLVKERSDTGRYYILNIDNVARQGPFDTKVHPVYQTNLCTEVMLPTQPFETVDDAGELIISLDGEDVVISNMATAILADGTEKLVRFISSDDDVVSFFVSNKEKIVIPPGIKFSIKSHTKPSIALCTLGSLNWGCFRNPEDLKRPAVVLHRALHNLLQYQDFLTVHSEMHNKEFEPLGIGVTNLAYWHAKRKMKYGAPDSLAEVKRWMEHQAFYLTETSVLLAKEKGPCVESPRTRYGQGVFPWELRAPGVNELADFTPSDDLDWEGLRSKMKEHGVRNATVSAIAPVESCQKNTNLINTPDGLKTIYDIAEHAGIDWLKVEKDNAIGFYDIDPIPIIGPDGNQDQILRLYYNGRAEVDELTFEDGTVMSFTPNHRLLVNRDGENIWVRVCDIREGDDVVETGDFRETEIPT